MEDHACGDGSEMMKKMLEKTKMAKLEDNPDVKKMIDRAGVCANEKQTSLLEEKGLACSSKKAASMIE